MKKSLVVIPPKWQKETFEKTEDCCVLLIPDSAMELLRYFNADCVVSYGISDKNTITLSSFSGNEMVVALQRELPTLDGDILERQELKMRRPAGITEESVLAVAGALLLIGMPPEKLSDFF